MKKEGMKSKGYKYLLYLVIVILILCIIIEALYIKFNYDISQIITNSEQEQIKLEYNFRYLTISNKNIQRIKSLNKQLVIVNDGYNIELNIDKLSNFVILDVDKEYVEDTSGVFSGKTYCKVSLSKYTHVDKIKSINIKIDKNIINSSVVDIYNNFQDIYMPSQTVVDDMVNIVPVKDNNSYNEFLIVYIPLDKINISEEKITINKNDTKDLKIELVPSNSTNKDIQFNIKDSKIAVINTDKILTGKAAGKTDVEISVKGETVKSTISVEVIPVLEDISLDKSSITLYVGESSTVKAKLVPSNAVNKTLEWTSTNTKVATVNNGKITAKKTGSCKITVKNTEGQIIEKSISIKVVNKPTYNEPSQSTVTGLTYVQGVLIANKKYALPSTYKPGTNSTAYNALLSLQKAAKKAGYNIPLLSGYRSYSTQKTIYNRYVSQYGQAVADTFSARPGHSEHQTGLAFDVGSITDSYGNTAAGKWLAKNCHKYGFIIRYPKGKQHITGYQYEPWHIRYLGEKLATDVYNSGLCLEEYLGI